MVEAKDQKILTSHSSTATVIIKVIDKNDHKPVITGKKVSKCEISGKININKISMLKWHVLDVMKLYVFELSNKHKDSCSSKFLVGTS